MSYKRIFTAFLIFIINGKIKSQVIFCPPGAEWNYSFGSIIENEKIKYVRDSVLNGETVKVLRHNKFYKAWNLPQSIGCILTLIKQRGDTVFMKNNGTKDTWQILYNFGALAGQSWRDSIGDVEPSFSYPGSESYTITVDSVRNVMVNNFSLRRLYVRYINEMSWDPYYRPVDTVQITERLGCSRFMFDYFSSYECADCGGTAVIEDFLCYQDDTFGLKQFTNYSCDYANVGVAKNVDYNYGITFYPNPVRENLTITSSTQPHMYKGLMENSLGQIIYLIDKLTAHQEIDMRPFCGGIYFLKIHTESGQNVFKIVKE